MASFFDAAFELTESDPFAAEREVERRQALCLEPPAPPRTVARWRVLAVLGAAVAVWTVIAAQMAGPPGISTLRVAVPAALPAASPAPHTTPPSHLAAAAPAQVRPVAQPARPSPSPSPTASPSFTPGPSARVVLLPTPSPSPPAPAVPSVPPLPALPGPSPSASPPAG